ncbi:B-cell receptor CD22-like [Actinia tenebrosa]|uniref:B-cell receptor CD22-like n=1 Tax=Actinia tenebrosa TaxID=6105 RepID=A0A6P8H1V8_ACTTE|nr:B-cell receptor CD22-like [Actinia tenebrosa]
MVKEFGVVNLTCTTSSNPASNYTWSLNGRSIEGANRSLFVKYNVSRYVAGEYKCTASNEFGAAYNVTVVNVMYPPEFICKEKLVVVEGQERNFSCNASAYPLPTYTVRYNFTNYPSKALLINLKRNDNGSIITCNASNSLGSAECKTVLIVTCKYYKRAARCNTAKKIKPIGV